MPRKYDVKDTRTWAQTKGTTTKTSTTPKSSTPANTSNKDKSGTASSKAKKDTATAKVTGEVNRITLTSLSGNLSMLPNENTIRIKPRDTIELKGLGKYLSGKYYVDSTEFSYSNSGISLTANVLKTNFKTTLKAIAKYPDDVTAKQEKAYIKALKAYKKRHKKAKPKSYVVKKANKETLYTISKKFFKKNSYAKALAKINYIPLKNRKKKLAKGTKLVIAKKY